ncbi:MAG TPA: hypothetical protein VGA61_17315 [Anaerolineae bacterium]
MSAATQYIPSEAQAIEEARETWQRGYRDAVAAGREVPVVDVPAELGDTARTSVEATRELSRLGNRRSYIVSVDIRALEAARVARENAAAKRHPKSAAKPSPRKRSKHRG